MSSKTPALTADEVRRIAALARLELTPGEVDLFTIQLGDILRYAADLQTIDTSGVPPTSHARIPNDTWRDDTPQPSLPAGAVIANAPDASERPVLFRVPKVIG
jgi:aspartyl-tRNA(Asn)/glutamyl-tRNA(Gln) amidotransferase subunit C